MSLQPAVVRVRSARLTTVVGAAAIACSVALMSAQTPAPQDAGAPAQGAPAGAVQGTPASDPARAAQVLAEARKALGGEDRFKAVQRLEIRGKAARALGNTNAEGNFEYQLELPDKFRRKESISMNQGGIDMLQILNGANASQKIETPEAGGAIGGFDGDGGGRGGRGGRGNIAQFASVIFGGVAVADGASPAEQQEAQQKAMSAEMTRLQAILLLAPPDPVWIGIAESPDGTADVLEFKTPDGVATRMLIDTKTRVPLLLSWTGIAPQLNFGGRGGGRGGRGGRGGGATVQQAELRLYVSDYKTVNNLRLPHLIQRGPNGETTEEFVVRNYRINPSFRADTFQP